VRIAEWEAEVARLKKDSSTSSKPPSSDIVKPPRSPASRGRRGKRRQGGQPGHRQHLRPLFPPEQVDHVPPVFEWTGKPLGRPLGLRLPLHFDRRPFHQTTAPLLVASAPVNGDRQSVPNASMELLQGTVSLE
jgi:hypothetical protein